MPFDSKGRAIDIPSLPPVLRRLTDLAYNLRWAWHHDTGALFRRLDSEHWEASGHNPVLMLKTIDASRLQAAAVDAGFLEHLERAARDLDEYLAGESTWYKRAGQRDEDFLVAYFSAEFGLNEILPIYSGGLGVLAGDHLKSASDLGVPLVGVGLLYQHGYFRQRLNPDGWQEEYYAANQFDNLPLVLERSADGTPLTVEIPFPGRRVVAQIWRTQVGRVSVYMLDTNVSANEPEDQPITDQLYGGDVETRIKQEIVLGIGGYRALGALGLQPSVCHMNEGHSAFLSLERARHLMEARGLPFAEASELARVGTVFTTHTPVEAGHDYFAPELMDRYFSDYIPGLGLSRWDFMALGRRNPHDDTDYFCMTVLALRTAAYSNGVSQLHGQVSRQMWQGIWAGVPEAEIPIGHVTNGVHLDSWVAPDLTRLYGEHLGAHWLGDTWVGASHPNDATGGWSRTATARKPESETKPPTDEVDWRQPIPPTPDLPTASPPDPAVHGGLIAGGYRLPERDLWETHQQRRAQLVDFARSRLRTQCERRGVPQEKVEAVCEALRPDILTVGFARRFATYKRATMLLRDPERLARILNDPERPVQIIFSGKAHPRDNGGKQFIQKIVELSRREAFRGRLLFLEDYDIEVARYLVQGSDVWLNNPRRPLEASGTSGMKAAANGGLNLSTLDGWWAEAWEGAQGDRSGLGRKQDSGHTARPRGVEGLVSDGDRTVAAERDQTLQEGPAQASHRHATPVPSPRPDPEGRQQSNGYPPSSQLPDPPVHGGLIAGGYTERPRGVEGLVSDADRAVAAERDQTLQEGAAPTTRNSPTPVPPPRPDLSVESDSIGWAIGQGETYDDADYQERIEADALYHLLEHEVVPTFYERDESGLPRRWIDRMTASIHTLAPFFNTDRMVREYTERYYLPAGEGFARAARPVVA